MACGIVVALITGERSAPRNTLRVMTVMSCACAVAGNNVSSARASAIRVMAPESIRSTRVVARLLLGILAVVFLPLGIVFTIVGATADQLDSGDPEDMLAVGLALGAVGLALTLAFAVLQRREIARRRRRREGLRTTAEIVDAQLNPNMRSGAKVALRLTVRFVPAGTVSRTLLVLPTSAPAAGARIDVLYDPADPTNFEPVLS